MEHVRETLAGPAFWVGEMDTEQKFEMSMLVVVDAAKGNNVEQRAEE